MFARMTRYEGGPVEGLDEAVETKRRVLPTSFGQTAGMKGMIFLAGRDAGTIVAISLWEDEEALRASEAEAERLREEVRGEGETASVERFEVAMLAIEQAPGVA